MLLLVHVDETVDYRLFDDLEERILSKIEIIIFFSKIGALKMSQGVNDL